MEENKKEGFLDVFIQFIKFGLVGVSNTIVSGVIYFLLNTVILPGVWIVASVVSWVISVLWAYFMQNIFVFKEDKNKEHRVWWQTLIKTYMTYAIISFFARIHIGFLGDAATFSSNMGWFINMIISIPLNFLINKFWAYRQKGGNK